MRDQLVVWMPACFIGLALPAMLSVQFLPFGTQSDDWTHGGHDGRRRPRKRDAGSSGAALGNFCWFMTIFCGFLVLAPTLCPDGRRHHSPLGGCLLDQQRADAPHGYGAHQIGLLQSAAGLCALRPVMLSLNPGTLITYATMFYNIALGVSCWHTLAINLTLLPPALRPGWFVRIAFRWRVVFLQPRRDRRYGPAGSAALNTRSRETGGLQTPRHDRM